MAYLRITGLIFAFTFCQLSAAIAQPSEVPNFLLFGTWLDDSSSQCVERIKFADDLTIKVTSGDEELVGKFVLETVPGSPPGLKVTRVIEASNGRKDCGGEISKVPSEPQPAFALFADKTTIFLCRDRQGTNCFGRYRRIQ